jgi:hypothetical protein
MFLHFVWFSLFGLCFVEILKFITDTIQAIIMFGYLSAFLSVPGLFSPSLVRLLPVRMNRAGGRPEMKIPIKHGCTWEDMFTYGHDKGDLNMYINIYFYT